MQQKHYFNAAKKVLTYLKCTVKCILNVQQSNTNISMLF